MKNSLETFLEDITLNSSFRVMDFGNSSDKEKMLEIAAKKNIVLPAYDLSIFECVYAFMDRQNKNGCTLPKAEVEKALATLNGKSIDLDHLRKQVVGHWVDAKLQDDKIIAYGCIFKGTFKEDYAVIKELFDKGNLAVSFEAWGNRVGSEDNYDLTDIEFAGGALLIKTEPAFDGAGVLEMAKSRVLEMASTMTKPEHFVRGAKKTEADPEMARMYVADLHHIMRNLQECSCPSCDTQGCMDPHSIDFANNKAKLGCGNCGAEMMADMTPAVSLSKKGRKIKSMSDYAMAPSAANLDQFINDAEITDERLELSIEDSLKPLPRISLASRFELADDDFAVLKTTESKGKGRKLRILPIHDLAHINLAKIVLEQASTQALLEKLSISKDSVDRKITRKVMTIAMKELFKKLNVASVKDVFQSIAKGSLKRELTEAELEKAYSIVALKAGKSAGVATSLLAPAGGAPASNATSLQTAEVAETDVVDAITQVTKVEAPAATENAGIEALQKQLTEATAKLAEVTTKLAEIEAAKVVAAEAEAATVRTNLIAARRTELTEAFAKDMKDEDLLDDAKFTLAKKDKEIAELKTAAVPVRGGKTDLTKVKTLNLVKGSTEKEVFANEKAARDRIGKIAFGSRHPQEKSKDTADE